MTRPSLAGIERGDHAREAKAASLYPFDGSDPDVIIALRQAFRDGALSSLEGSPT